MKQKANKIGIGIVGGIVLIAGIVMIPYPGPGWLVVFMGLGILSTEFIWAQRVLHFAKSKYDAWEVWLKSQPQWIRSIFWLLTATVVVLTLWLLNVYGMMNSLFKLNIDWLDSPIF